jgi:ABC-type nitrate/sulfonate/bicarbonate transport system substrate-binding protein
MAFFYTVGRRLFTVLLLTFAVFSSPWLLANDSPPTSTNNAALDKVRLQLKWYHQFQFAGYYAALQQGYYEEAG